jgi:hypothetical protein
MLRHVVYASLLHFGVETAYSNYLGDIHVVTPSNDAATAKDVTIDPDYAVVRGTAELIPC